MSVLLQIKDYLEQCKASYSTITHPRTYTAQETAQAIHVSGHKLAKCVVIKIDGRLALAVLPASQQIDTWKFKQILGAKRIELATELEFAESFPGCDPGAVPAFGRLFGLPVYLASDLHDDLQENIEEIVLNSGSHHEVICMKYSDFERLVYPIVCDFSTSSGRTSKRRQWN